MVYRQQRLRRSRSTLILLLVSSVILITLDLRGVAVVGSVRSGVMTIFSPVSDGIGNIFHPIGTFWHGAWNYEEVDKENESLREQIDTLQSDILLESTARQELEQLQQQLDIPFIGQYETTRARVVSGAITNITTTIEIDKGSSSGIKKGMPIVLGSGLIGSVLRVTPSRSVIRLISDPTFQVSVTTMQNDLGIVHGQGDTTVGKLRDVDISSELEPESLLVTSGGVGSYFPPDIPIGTVQEISRDEASLSQSADVHFFADLSHIRYVTVVLFEPVGA